MDIWYSRGVDSRISQMFETIRDYKLTPRDKPRPFITISREYGCEAFQVAAELAERLNRHDKEANPWVVYDRKLVEKVADDLEVTNDIIAKMTTEHRNAFEEFLSSMVLQIPSNDKIYKRIAKLIRGVAWHGNAIIIGRGGAFLCNDMNAGFHFRIVAPFEWRLKRLVEGKHDVDPVKMRTKLTSMDKERNTFYRKYFAPASLEAYDFAMTFNNENLNANEIVDHILLTMKGKKFFPGKQLLSQIHY